MCHRHGVTSTAASVAAPTPTPTGSATGPAWLRGPGFDSALIGAPLALALMAGLTLVREPGAWQLLFVLDTWLLGYHHVIATWSKLGLDPDDRREHRLLWTALPLVVLFAVWGTAAVGGARALATVYFHWQWWHYARQSWGLLRLYQRRAGQPDDRLAALVLYGWAALGLAYRSWEQEGAFLGMPLAQLPLPGWSVVALAVPVGAVTLAWAARELAAWRGWPPLPGLAAPGPFRPLPALFLLSHVVVFAWGYMGVWWLTGGWLVLNVWHNAQYLLLVWHAQAARFAKAPATSPRLARLGTPAGALGWAALGLALTALVYGPLTWATGERELVPGVTLFLLANQAINWHHYVVDALIWRLRKPRVASGLGLAAPA